MSDMQKLQENLLNAFPEAALLLSRGHVAAANQAVRHLLPRLEDGGEVPPELERLPEENGGLVTVGGSAWRVQMTQTQWGRLIVLLPAVQTAVTAAQLDGSLRQMRTYLAQMQLAAEDIPLSSRGMFWKSYHQMFRLMDNLDLLRQLGQPGGAALQLAALDLTALCRRAVQSCTWLLERAGVKLAYDSPPAALLAPGDVALLERVLLELIANGARWTGQGTLKLSLRRLGTRGVVTVTPGHGLPRQRLDELLRRESGYGVPRPGTGAGIGIPLAETIVKLHGGSLLMNTGEDGIPVAVLALPTGPMPTRVTVRTPRVQRSGGLSAPLVALADILPAESFCPEEEANLST